MQSKTPFLTAGAAIGFLVGYLTRPTFMGMKLPLEVLWNGHPADAGFRSDLISHLAITVGLGIVAAWLVHMFVAGKDRERVGGVVSGADLAKWQSLIDLDTDIAKAAETARSKDAECEQVLARKYLPLNDKAYLDAALRHALEDFAARIKRQEAMSTIEIRWASVQRFQGVEFRRGVALSQQGESKFIVQGGLWSIDDGPLSGRNFPNEQEMRAALAGDTSQVS